MDGSRFSIIDTTMIIHSLNFGLQFCYRAVFTRNNETADEMKRKNAFLVGLVGRINAGLMVIYLLFIHLWSNAHILFSCTVHSVDQYILQQS